MNDYPDDFLKAFAFVLKWEVGGDLTHGGYLSAARAAQRGDPGGETKWGISRRSYPDLDIEHLTLDRAREIYFADYWENGNQDTNQRSYCSAMAWPLNLVHFDCVVNIGNRKTALDGTPVWHRRATMILQRALNVDDDGYVGPVTFQALSTAEPLRVALKAITQRDYYYSTLGSWSVPHQRGWLRRTGDARATVLRRAPPAVPAGGSAPN